MCAKCSKPHRCPKCGWTGLGSEGLDDEGNADDSWWVWICPKCYTTLEEVEPAKEVSHSDV